MIPPDRSINISKPFLSMAEWVRNKTEVGTLLLTPPHKKTNYYALRGISQRGLLVHGRDGKWPLALNIPQYAKEWSKLYQEVKSLYETGQAEDFILLSKKYRVDYIVLEKNHNKKLGLPVVFKNSDYVIYKVI